MSRPDVLVVWPILPDQMRQLDERYTLHRYDQAADKDVFLNGKAASIRAVVTTGGHGFTADLLDKLPNLEIVGASGVGVDKIDVAACRARGVPVTNTPDVLNDDVADLGFGLVIACLREMPQGHAYVKSGDWGREGMMHLTTHALGQDDRHRRPRPHRPRDRRPGARLQDAESPIPGATARTCRSSTSPTWSSSPVARTC